MHLDISYAFIYFLRYDRFIEFDVQELSTSYVLHPIVLFVDIVSAIVLLFMLAQSLENTKNT